MIARLQGLLIQATPTCVVGVGGIGFELQIPEKDRGFLTAATGEVTFHTYLYVREDRLTLFGFLRHEERELFTRLIDVSGIGPRIALGTMAEHTSEHIVQAIVTEDHAFLCMLPGLGRKTAERLTVDLKDKLGDLASGAEVLGDEEIPSIRKEAMLALTTLGMQRSAAERALNRIDWQSEGTQNLEAVIKQALKHGSGV